MRELIKNLWEQVSEKKEKLGAAPPVLSGRLLTDGALLFLLSILGIFFAVLQTDRMYLLFAGVLCLYMGIRIMRLWRAICRREYEVCEGTIVKIKGKHTPSRFIKVTLMIGQEEKTFLLSKETGVKEGKTYRFYFRKEKAGGVSFGRLDVGNFYGVEEVS